MTKQIEALKMAHKSFMQLNERHPRKDNGNGYFDEEIQACKEALERPTNMVAVPADQLEKMQQELKQLRKQQTQEPVAWMDSEGRFRLDFKTEIVRSISAVNKEIPLYTHPAPSWQGLSDGDFKDTSWFTDEFIEGANWAQNKLKEKNT